MVYPDGRSTPDDGVDLTLIRYALRLTPLERLELMCDWANQILEMSDAAEAFRRSRDSDLSPGPRG